MNGQTSIREVHPGSGEPQVQRFGRGHVTWWILLTGVVLRIIFFLLSANNGGDAVARAAWTAEWVKHPSLRLDYGGDYLPLHFWLMGSLALLVGNAELASRLLSLLTGVASLWLVWKIARQIYTETASNLSLLVFALYSLHIGYSTTSSSEVPYLLFVLAGLLCFLIYQRSSRLGWIALSGICFTLGAAIRYEAWVVMFGVAFVLLDASWRIAQCSFWRWPHLSPLILFGLTAGSWPAFWMYYSSLQWKQPLHFLAIGHANVAQELVLHHASLLYRLALFPGTLLLALSPVAFLAALYALWLAAREPTGRQIALIVLVLGFVQFYEIVSSGLATRARYTITLGTLLAIISGYGIERIAHRWFRQAKRAVYIVIIAVLALNLGAILALSEMPWRFSEKFGSISPRLRFPNYIQTLSAELRRRLDPRDALVIDNYNVESNIVARAVGLPFSTDRLFLASREQPSNLRSDLQNFIKTKRPKYLVYSDQGTLRLYFPLPSRCPSKPVSTEGVEFHCLFANKIYTLYELSYPSSKKLISDRDRTMP